MKNRLILFLAYFFMVGAAFCQTNEKLKIFAPQLSSEIYEGNRNQVEAELGKKTKIVRFLNLDNPRISQELEMWNTFLEYIDRDLIGVLFIANRGLGDQTPLWENLVPSHIPLVIDPEKSIKITNEIGEEYAMHSLLLNESLAIIGNTGSPIVPDNYDLMRSVLGHELKRMGYKSGIIGPITDPTAGNPTWLMGEAIYVMQDGKKLSKNEFFRLLESGAYYPQYTASDTVMMIKRN